MANNIIGGRRNVVHALVDATFESMGINSTNTYRIILYDGTPVSYDPTRQINAFEGAVTGKGYIIIANTDMDLSAYFGPPFPNSGTDTWNEKDF